MLHCLQSSNRSIDMFYRVLFVILVSLSFVSNAFAEIKRVAVLEFRGVGV